MTETWESIREEVARRPPLEALEIIRQNREIVAKRISEDTAFLGKLDRLRSKLVSVIESLDTDDSAEAEDVMPSHGGWKSGISTTSAVVAALRNADKALTFDELNAFVPGTTKASLYNIVHGSKDSLTKKGQVIFDQTNRPGVLSMNPDYSETDSISEYIADLVEYDPAMKVDDQVVRRLGEAIQVYTEKHIWPNNNGKRLRANHTWKSIRNRGVIGAIEYMVESRPTTGFNAMAMLGRLDLTAEKIVIDFPDRFDPTVVEKAKARYAEFKAAA